jgi:outer membrane protein
MYIVLPAVLFGAEPLSIREAARAALKNNNQIVAAVAGVAQAAARQRLAGAAYQPTVGISDSSVFTNQPVDTFVYKLLQRDFGVNDLTLNGINRPSPYSNFQTQLHISQLIYDGGLTKTQQRISRAATEIARQNVKITSDQIVAAVARSYYGVVLSRENIRLARESIKSAEADLKRAQDIYEVGRSTELDVLTLKVQLEGMHEEEIRRTAEFDVWNATLNQLMGKPLDTQYGLVTPLKAAKIDPTMREPQESHEATATHDRPEAKRSLLQIETAEEQRNTVIEGYRPQISFLGFGELDRRYWATRGSGNYFFDLQVEWTVFDGARRREKLSDAEEGIRQAKAGHEELLSSVRLEVRRGQAELKGAQQRLEVAAVAIDQSKEALRIVESRYAAGLSSVTDLIHGQTALLEVQTRYLASTYEQRLAVIALELAAGHLDETKID